MGHVRARAAAAHICKASRSCIGHELRDRCAIELRIGTTGVEHRWGGVQVHSDDAARDRRG
eukprot:4587631-Heterocapsa_arctica.AAC.1